VTSNNEIIAQGPCGRPLVKIRVHGVPMTAFIDSGSEVTLLKIEGTKSITPKRIHHQVRGLRGVSGRLFEATSEWDVEISLGNGRKIRRCHHRVCVVEGVDFPGNILIGMDFLRRFCYRLVHKSVPQKAYLRLGGVTLPITYTDGCTLGISGISEFIPPEHSQRLAIRRTTQCPSRSGRYIPVTVPEAFNHKEVIIEGATDKIIVPRTVVIPKDGVASVWVVNGGTRPVHLQNGTHVATGQVCTVIEFDRVSKEPSLVGQAQEERMSEDSSEPKLDDDDIPDPHFSFDKEDDFDIAYGQLDFGYNDNDFIVFPEISLDDPPEVSMLTTSGDEV